MNKFNLNYLNNKNKTGPFTETGAPSLKTTNNRQLSFGKDPQRTYSVDSPRINSNAYSGFSGSNSYGSSFPKLGSNPLYTGSKTPWLDLAGTAIREGANNGFPGLKAGGALAGLGALAGAWLTSGGADRAAGKNTDRLAGLSGDWGKVAEWAKENGYSDLADAATNWGDNAGKRAEWWKDWEWGKGIGQIGDAIETGVNSALDKGKDNAIANVERLGDIQHEARLQGKRINNVFFDEYDDYDSALDKIDTNTNVTTGLKPGQESAVGSHYSGYETDALGNLSKMGDQTYQGYGQEAVDLVKKLRGEQTDLEKNLNSVYNNVATGGISPADMNYLTSAKKVLDGQHNSEAEALMENLGISNQLWGGRQGKLMGDLAEKYEDKENALLGELSKQRMTEANSLLKNQQGYELGMTNAASNIMGNKDDATLSSNKASLDHTLGAGKLQNDQRNLQLQESLAKIQNDMKLAELLGVKATT